MHINLARLTDALQGLQITVIGDPILDVYLHGHIERLCREAPVPIVGIDIIDDVPGGAANAAVNAAALGARVRFIGLIGDDAEGERLRRALRARGVATDGLVTAPGRRTSTKQRLLAGEQILARFDNGTGGTPAPADDAILCQRVRAALDDTNAVIVSDYGCGSVSDDVLALLAPTARAKPLSIVGDGHDFARLARIQPTAVKPSYAEAVRLLAVDAAPTAHGRAEWVNAHAQAILARSGARIAAVTLDADGAVVLERHRAPYRTYARAVPPSRSTGSGDTFVAALALALAAGADTPEAAELASAAAGVVVAKDGTAACSARELHQAIEGSDKRLIDAAGLCERVTQARARGRRVVFTNGCFDILHRGHVTLLNRAKGLGDLLVVGVNSDDSVRRLKGPARPINALDDRVKVLAALSYVDYVIPFDDDSPRELIRAVRPDIYVKGGDYTRETLPEAPLVESLGGAVCILPFVEERSTSGIIARIRSVA